MGQRQTQLEPSYPILTNGFDQNLIWGSIYDAYMEVNQVPESQLGDANNGAPKIHMCNLYIQKARFFIISLTQSSLAVRSPEDTKKPSPFRIIPIDQITNAFLILPRTHRPSRPQFAGNSKRICRRSLGSKESTVNVPYSIHFVQNSLPIGITRRTWTWWRAGSAWDGNRPAASGCGKRDGSGQPRRASRDRLRRRRSSLASSSSPIYAR